MDFSILHNTTFWLWVVAGWAVLGGQVAVQRPAEPRSLQSAIYRAVLDEDGVQPPKSVVVRLESVRLFRTSAREGCHGIVLSEDWTWDDSPHGALIASLLLENSKETLVQIQPMSTVRLVSGKSLDVVFGKKHSWRNFWRTYPRAIGIMSLSRPAVSADGLHAVLYSGIACGDDCGMGLLLRLTLVEGRWTVVGRDIVWVS